MNKFFDPTPQAIETLKQLADQIPDIQQVLVNNHKQLKTPDRAAHQQQLGGSMVRLVIAQQLPSELAGLGVFNTESSNDDAKQEYVGIGRISTGLGCPHIETDPDFMGIMLAFRTREGRRVDFIGINDPSTPTDSVSDFMALLHATADAAGTEVPFGDVGSLDLGNLIASQAKVVGSLGERLGTARALKIFGHVGEQTTRTLKSSSAFQQYWTGIVRANDLLGKFTLVPTKEVNEHRGVSPGERLFSSDWTRRQSDGDLEFRLYWIPFLNENDTSLDKLTQGWKEAHKVEVATVVFPKTDFGKRQAKLVALLASEMGANPGNWVSQKTEGAQPEFPATEFTAGRFLAYRKSQEGRDALREEMYDSFFANGEINEELAARLIRRYNNKRQAGHAVPDIGQVNP